MALRRLENDDEQFWEAWVTDLTLSCRYGKLGSDGKTEHEKFWTRADAHAELEARLEEKLDEGFIEVEVVARKPPEDPSVFLFFFVCLFFLSLALMLPSRPGPQARYGRPAPKANTPEHPFWGPSGP